jgi:precorrin-4/cobalt-precorrin-4 C11-methyltransferase
VYKVSSEEEKVILSPLSKISEKVAQAGFKKTALVIVGRVLAQNFERSLLYNKEFINEKR